MARTINIIGMGLIGTSLARDALRSGYQVRGYEKDIENRDAASNILKIPVADIDQPLLPADLTILCTPPADIVSRLPKLLDEPPGILCDVASVKSPIAKAVANHANRRLYVSAHPMAGRELSGPRAAQDALFRNRPCLFCDVELSDPDGYQLVRDFLLGACAMFPAEMPSDVHDRHVAVISHLPHILAYILNDLVWSTPGVCPQLGGSGLDGMIRLAKSDPNLWQDILLTNAPALKQPLDQTINYLSRLQKVLQDGDAVTLREIIKQLP